MKYVMKFGEASLADHQAISGAVRILADYQTKGHRLVAVVSALPKVNDELGRISEEAIDAKPETINEFVERHTKRHIQTARQCIRNPRILTKVVMQLEEKSTEIHEILTSIARLKELTPRSKDFVLSFGVKLAAPIVCGAAIESGLKSEWLTGGEAGITTDENFGEANPLTDLTVRKVKTKLGPMLSEGKVPIVTGYAAATPHGVTTTLGRGGSDYTATLIGASLDVDEVFIWKEVEGIMTADPEIVPNAKLLRRISYAEASEMAYFGAKAIHPRALQPVMNKQIPVRIRSAFDLTSEGTLVESERKVKTGAVVKAVTLVSNVAMVNVTSAEMVGLPGAAAKVFKVLDDTGINILMISQSSSEAGISFVIPREKLQQTKKALGLGLIGTKLTNLVSEDDVCVVAAVGAGMKGTPGVAARVFSAVAVKGANVRMIAQGSSELNISFVVAEKDGPKSIRALHEEFNLGENP